jgi:hypothetical protein
LWQPSVGFLFATRRTAAVDADERDVVNGLARVPNRDAAMTSIFIRTVFHLMKHPFVNFAAVKMRKPAITCCRAVEK